MNPTPSERYPYHHHPLQAAAQLSWNDRNTSLDAVRSALTTNSLQRSTPKPQRRRRVQPLLMEVSCAECGCVVRAGVIVNPCSHYPDCCCSDMPMQPEEPSTNSG